jgi:hypothetical protein
MEAARASSVDDDGPILVLGDTQRTHWAEERLLFREQNERARRALIRQIARTETPAFLVHLGDLVTVGSARDDWEYYDRLMSPLTARGIVIVPVLGNHEYWGDDAAALGLARERFPALDDATFYVRVHGSLGLVFVDTNLDGALGRAQRDWLHEVLSAMDDAPAIRGVLVFGHHPASTNGIGRRGSDYVNEALMPAFEAASKTLAYFAGHVHGYERFERRGKTLVVSGGGGGPRVTFRIGDDAAHAPLYAPATPGPLPFHYLRLEVVEDVVVVEAPCLRDDAGCEEGILERFELPLPSPGGRAPASP